MKAREDKLIENAENFLNYCRTMKGLTTDTLKSYRSDLHLLFDFLKIHKNKKDITNMVIKKVELKDLNAFMMYLENKEKSCGASARTRKTYTLKSYFEYLQNIEKLITVNPAYGLIVPKKQKRNPIYLSLNESKQLLTSMNKNNENYTRDYCIVTLFLQTGMRLSELEGIKVDNIKGDVLTVIGKGNKERTIYMNETCLKVLNDYLNIRDDYNILDGRLFNIKKGRIEVLVKEYIQNSGINDSSKYTVHKLRHTSATLMYKYGKVDIRQLQSILGHSSVSNTQIYTHVDDEQSREAVKSNPLNNL
jgi:site-specific recombinase XerD